MKGKAKPKKEAKKPKQTKAHAAQKLAAPVEFMTTIARKGWRLTPSRGAA